MPRERNTQNRLACNSCHNQKLRCQRQEDQGSCRRCTESNTACIFSPRQRRTVKTRNISPLPISQEHTQHDAVNFSHLDISNESTLIADQQDLLLHTTDLNTLHNAVYSSFDSFLGKDAATGDSAFADWTGPPSLEDCHRDIATSQDKIGLDVETHVDFEGVLRMPWSKDVTGHIDQINKGILHGAPEQAVITTEKNETSILGYIRQLADLNVQLYEHADKLPPLGTEPSNRLPSLEGRVFAIDETFRLTQSLIDIINSLYPRTTTPPDFIPDQSTVLLIMSSSSRVFDIHEMIFGHMRGCIQHKITPVASDGNTLLLPQLLIGSFAPPTPSAIAMQMLLIVLMASELFDQLQDVLGVWQHSKHFSRTSGPIQSSHGHFEELELTVGTRKRYPDFTEEAKSEICRRATCIAEKISNTRRLLLNMPGMRGTGSLQNCISNIQC